MSKTKILKLVMFVVALVICIGATIYLFPVMRNLSTVEGQVAFKQKVENSGVLGLISLFALEVAQIFLFVIPGEPIEILAGMCYGALWGTVFIMVSAGLISTVIFFLVRKLGKKFVYEFCDENKVKKIENKSTDNSKELQNTDAQLDTVKYAHAKDEPVTFQCTQNPDNPHIPQIQILSQGSVQILSVCLNGTECPWHWEEDKVVSDTEADGDQNKIELLAVSQGGKLIKMDPWIFSA